MRLGRFRFAALLELYRSQEDSLRNEVASLQRERRNLEEERAGLSASCREAREGLRSGGSMWELESVLRYVEGLQVRIEQAREREAALGREIGKRMASLQEVRRERMRFDKLKDRYQIRLQRHLKALEQKGTDEFAQRKWSR